MHTVRIVLITILICGVIVAALVMEALREFFGWGFKVAEKKTEKEG